MDMLATMKAWEASGKVGDGPAETKAAASGTRLPYDLAVTARYLLNRPNYAAPPTDPGIPDSAGPKPHPDTWTSGTRTWTNYLNQGATKVSAWRRPNPNGAAWKDQVAEVGAAMAEAKAAGKRIRTIGGGHAAGDVSKPDTDGFLLQVDDCKPVSDPPYLPAGADKSTLVWVGGGVRIADLNAKLAARGQSMPNMGGYNGQTVAGALCTGTHGAGLEIPALYGVIASIWIVVLDSHGSPELRIVEPTAGFSDAAAFAADPVKQGDIPRRIIKDDATFQAVTMGVGWLGVVFAMTLNVRRTYWLRQTKEMKTYASVKSTFAADIKAHRHYEFALSPLPCWQKDGTYDHSCLTVRRDAAPVGTNPKWPSTKWMGAIDNLVKDDPRGFTAAADLMQEVVGVNALGAFVHNALAGMQVADFTSAVPNILLLPYGNHFRAKSCEIHVRLPDAFHAIDTLLTAIRKFAHTAGNVRVINSPMGVRVVAATKGPLSSFDWGYATPTLTIEVPIIIDANNKGWCGTSAEALLMDVFGSLAAANIPARLHWGQYHQIDRAQMIAFYGAARVAAFEKVWADFNPTKVTGSIASDRLHFP